MFNTSLNVQMHPITIETFIIVIIIKNNSIALKFSETQSRQRIKTKGVKQFIIDGSSCKQFDWYAGELWKISKFKQVGFQFTAKCCYISHRLNTNME